MTTSASPRWATLYQDSAGRWRVVQNTWSREAVAADGPTLRAAIAAFERAADAEASPLRVKAGDIVTLAHSPSGDTLGSREVVARDDGQLELEHLGGRFSPALGALALMLHDGGWRITSVNGEPVDGDVQIDGLPPSGDGALRLAEDLAGVLWAHGHEVASLDELRAFLDLALDEADAAYRARKEGSQ